MAEKNIGAIIQIIGSVIDVRFEGDLPLLYNALEVKLGDDTVVLEVMQHTGDNTVRCVSMHPTEGLKRGAEVVDTGAPITVPIGREVLGRMVNILGKPIDNKPEIEAEEYWPILGIRRPLLINRLSPKCWRQA